jgi:hypothetical protein
MQGRSLVLTGPPPTTAVISLAEIVFSVSRAMFSFALRMDFFMASSYHNHRATPEIRFLNLPMAYTGVRARLTALWLHHARRRARCHTRPAAVIVQAASAAYTNTCAIAIRYGASIARDSRTVHTVYIPRGNTAPQYSGS